MALNIVRLVALASLAVLGASFGAQPANAVSLESHHFVRHDHAARHHGIVAKRQASTRPRRCRARTSSLADGSSSANGATSTTSATTSGAATTSARPTTTQAPPPPPASTSKAQAPATSSSPATSNNNNNNNGGGGGGSGKVGIAYAGNVNVPAFIAGSKQVRYIYNWSPWKPEFMDEIPWVDYVPMFWGEKQAADFTRLVKGGYARFVLGMNEPNQEGQANINAGHGADLWRRYIQPLKSQGYTLISPAPTNAPSGKKWLQDFLQACGGGCTVDAIATHWYGTDAQQFISHLNDYHNTFGRRLWVTEYACQDFSGRNQQCSANQVASFMRTTRDFMEGASFVQAYFYFGVLHDMNNVQYTNKLINGDSTPNTLGRTYIGY